MIVDRDIHPGRNLFYVGGEILKIIQEHRFGVISVLDLFEKISPAVEHSLSLDDLILALDWLFLLGAVKNNSKGDILRCF